MNNQSKKNSINLLKLHDNSEPRLSLALRMVIILSRIEQRLCQLTNDWPRDTVNVIWRRSTPETVHFMNTLWKKI